MERNAEQRPYTGWDVGRVVVGALSAVEIIAVMSDADVLPDMTYRQAMVAGIVGSVGFFQSLPAFGRLATPRQHR